MKIWTRRNIKNITQNSGELLVETIISIALLSVLLLAVITIIQSSRSVLSTSIQNAKTFQEDVVNQAILVSYSDGTSTEIEFQYSYYIGGERKDKSATHDIIYDDGIKAFSPSEDVS